MACLRVKVTYLLGCLELEGERYGAAVALDGAIQEPKWLSSRQAVCHGGNSNSRLHLHPNLHVEAFKHAQMCAILQCNMQCMCEQQTPSAHHVSGCPPQHPLA